MVVRERANGLGAPEAATRFAWPMSMMTMRPCSLINRFSGLKEKTRSLLKSVATKVSCLITQLLHKRKVNLTGKRAQSEHFQLSQQNSDFQNTVRHNRIQVASKTIKHSPNSWQTLRQPLQVPVRHSESVALGHSTDDIPQDASGSTLSQRLPSHARLL